jgi:hypothetical protein
MAKNNNDLHIVKEEFYDPDVMEYILKDINTYPHNELLKLRNYKKGRKQGNCVEVIYYYGKGYEQNHLGRLYVKGNKGLQAFPHDIRNPLLEKNYWDIDCENMHYNLMHKIGTDWGVVVNNIKYYCDNRNECLEKLSSNRKTAKIAFLKVAFGGNIKLYDEYCNDDGIEPEGDLTLLRSIEIETHNLMDMCYAKYPEFHDVVKLKHNPKSSLFALILQTEERKCILALDEYFKLMGRNVDILIHDGIEVRKLPNENSFPDVLLRGGEKSIFDVTNHNIKLVSKPLEHNLIMKKTPVCVIDDVYAARKFIELMGNQIVRDKNDVYFFNGVNGLWEKNDTAFRIAVTKHKFNLLFEDTTGKIINYGGIEKNVNSMKKWILSLLPDNNFISNNIDTSIGKLLFTDGIYDFVTDTFTTGFNPNIIFFKRINRNYPTDRDEDIIKIVNKILFIDAFNDGNNNEAGTYFKKILCVSLIGDYLRKKFFFGVGKSNSGKGLLVSAFRNAFEEYIDEYDANNLLYNPQNSQDEAKRLSWVNDLIGVRIAFSNECRITDNNKGIDGNLLKSLSSGGDNLKIRGNYETQHNFINRSTMFQLSNDCPNITPIDSGISERAKFIRYTLNFCDNPKDIDERLADPQIKVKFQTESYKNALFNIMVDTYKSFNFDEKKLGGRIIEPKCVVLETKEWIKNENDLFLEKLNERFEITNDVNDHVESKKLIDYLVNSCNYINKINKC